MTGFFHRLLNPESADTDELRNLIELAAEEKRLRDMRK